MAATAALFGTRASSMPIPDNPALLPENGPSAFIGRSPSNQRDYYIVKGLLRMVGMKDANPMMGYFLAARPPLEYQHESRVFGVQIGLVIVMVLIVLPTAVRLVLRARKEHMRFGWDDWTLLVAAVS
jgi:uncharacterized membrane protein YedE/YeeE